MGQRAINKPLMLYKKLYLNSRDNSINSGALGGGQVVSRGVRSFNLRPSNSRPVENLFWRIVESASDRAARRRAITISNLQRPVAIQI